MELMEYPRIRSIAIIAEGVPERVCLPFFTFYGVDKADSGSTAGSGDLACG